MREREERETKCSQLQAERSVKAFKTCTTEVHQESIYLHEMALRKYKKEKRNPILLLEADCVQEERGHVVLPEESHLCLRALSGLLLPEKQQPHVSILGDLLATFGGFVDEHHWQQKCPNQTCCCCNAKSVRQIFSV